MIISSILKIFIPATAAFVVGIALAPLLTRFLYSIKAWKKSAERTALDGSAAVEFARLRANTETSTPRMGGILIWSSVLVVIGVLSILAQLFPVASVEKLQFLSRNQTWVPLVTLLFGATIGLLNDLIDISPAGGRGLRLRVRLLLITGMSAAIGWWFYSKLGMVSIGVPGDGAHFIGIWILPLFIITALGLYAGGVIDGIDGLAGGVFGSIFAAYAGIAYFQNQIDLAAFCATLTGAILAFLWFNIPPARFWMTETGTMGLTLTLAVVAFMTDTPGDGYGIAALPIIALPLLLTVGSNVIQVLSKRFRGKKVFRIAPLHHHLEAIGWASTKVTMRYWVISVVCAIAGMTVALLK